VIYERLVQPARSYATPANFEHAPAAGKALGSVARVSQDVGGAPHESCAVRLSLCTLRRA